jgi:hypothetical protein
MQIIEAERPPCNDAAFDTPVQAIAYARRQINRTRRGEDLTPYVGRTIVSVQWRDDALRLQLDSGIALQFGIVEQLVDVAIINAAAAQQWGPGTIEDTALIRFGTNASIWRRGELMRSLQGNDFRRMQLGGVMFSFLYISNVGILHLSTAIDRATSLPLLYWHLSD